MKPIVHVGEECQVLIGDDVVVTGYVGKVISNVSSNDHTVRILGRGRCQDLVDCSAEWPSCEISNSDILATAKKLASPYNIDVRLVDGADVSAILPQFNITLTETPFGIIEEMARYYALLVYEDPRGNLLLSTVGKQRAASGIEYGLNVQDASVQFSADERFSEYMAFLMNMEVLGDVGVSGNLKASVPDPNVSRHRRRAIIAEAPSGGQDLAERRASWEAARRAGRGTQINATVDSWRDSSGTLWAPNTLVPVSLPLLDLPKDHYCLGEVTFIFSEATGTIANLTLFPPSAYSPEPILLQPSLPDIQLGAGQ